jgi:LysR family transcriptional regulator, benzoate and cis,cis-muconate-responsive activator of ben and cat genes
VIELQHLVYFVAVAEEGSIRAGAQRLHLTQPPLSRHMRSLEERIGVQLLRRTPRGVTLTPAGEVMLVEARETLARLDGSLERVQRAAEGAGSIRFGVVGATGADLIPGLIAGLALQSPPVDVEVVELPSVRTLTAFQRLGCDAGFLRRHLDVVAASDAAPGVELETIRQDRTVLVVPPDHRLAEAGEVELSALGGEHLIVTAGSRDAILELSAHYSFAVASVTEAPTIPAVLGLIASGRGVGWMAATTPVQHHHEVVSVPVAGYTSPVALVWAAAVPEPLRRRIRTAALAHVNGAAIPVR